MDWESSQGSSKCGRDLEARSTGEDIRDGPEQTLHFIEEKTETQSADRHY